MKKAFDMPINTDSRDNLSLALPYQPAILLISTIIN